MQTTFSSRNKSPPIELQVDWFIFEYTRISLFWYISVHRDFFWSSYKGDRTKIFEKKEEMTFSWLQYGYEMPHN
jgi:hypothetical protein